jgi:hypothetical protein
MPKYNKRTQVLLSEELYDRLLRESRVRGESMGSLIRDAVEQAYPDDLKEKQRIVEKICSMNLPVSDWETMEEEITARWLPEEDEDVDEDRES